MIAGVGSTMNDSEQFSLECIANAAAMAEDASLRTKSIDWIQSTSKYKYTYNFTWLGLPVIQFPQDLMALQQIIWAVQPRVVIETGVARGGSLLFYASLLEMIGIDGEVIGIDIDLRQHNRDAITAHPLSRRIRLLDGSSIEDSVVARVKSIVDNRSPVVVVLDSSHTHSHVLAELLAYSPLVCSGSYLIVLDTIVEDMDASLFSDRPWGKSNNPKTAVREFMSLTDRFVIDKDIENKLLISVAPSGYLRCVRDPD
jgi:cephalosporin hydroxylase